MGYIQNSGAYTNINAASIYGIGVTGGGQDYAWTNINSLSTWSGNGVIETSRLVQSFAGVSGVSTIYQISGTTPVTFTVKDIAGGAAKSNIIISGASNLGITIDGATTATINTNYGHATFALVSGSATQSGSSWGQV